MKRILALVALALTLGGCGASGEVRAEGGPLRSSATSSAEAASTGEWSAGDMSPADAARVACAMAEGVTAASEPGAFAAVGATLARAADPAGAKLGARLWELAGEGSRHEMYRGFLDVAEYCLGVAA